ncbi:MAG: hypothetical protein J3R72DRAFT_418224 [Linnemannia gamsii]|nr:MAG: hypothetical protein J3R72DRAFT_418224 [Linnemannia gamsii]
MVVLIPMFCPPTGSTPTTSRLSTDATSPSARRSLNNILYWGLTDRWILLLCPVPRLPGVNRRTRALCGLTIISAAFNRHLGSERTYTIDMPKPNHDFKEGSSYVGPLFLYMFYGLNDAAWQTYIYWMMGAMSNDATVLSRYAGFYKCIQSCGAAISWRINAVGTPYMTELIICFALLGLSVPGALFLAARIQDHSDEDVEPEKDSHDMDKF